MQYTNPRIEGLILRHLDGELTDRDRQELEAVLKDDPAARALYEEYRRLDDTAGEALGALLGHEAEETLRFPEPAAKPVYSVRWTWWGLPFAAAAAITLAVMIPRLDLGGTRNVPSPEPRVADLSPSNDTKAGLASDENPAAFSPEIDRARDTQTWYIVGPDGEMYVIEQEHTRTQRVPNAGMRLASL